jgi:hypothetical protein
MLQASKYETLSKLDDMLIIANDLLESVSYRTIVDIACIDCAGPMITALTPHHLGCPTTHRGYNYEDRSDLAGWRAEGQSF